MIFNPQLKLATHPEFTKYISGDPIKCINLEISVSSVCNAQCAFCIYREDKNEKEKFINVEKLVDFLYYAFESGLRALTWTGGGEPTMHPDFPEIVSSVYGATKLKQGLFTNALAPIKYLPERLEWIRITKTNKPLIEGNIKDISERCKRVGICINYSNASQAEDIEIALEIAYKFNLAYVQVRPVLDILGKMSKIKSPKIHDEKLIITEYKFNECYRKTREYNRCEGYHFVPTIWEDGLMQTCGYKRYDRAYDIGSIYKKSFDELCVAMPPSVPVTPDCQICCKNHEINRLIYNSRLIEDKDFV